MKRRAGDRDIEIGACVTRLRTVRGLTMTQLAERIAAYDGDPPLSFQQIQKFETGANRISATLLENIAKVLNVPTDTFFEKRQETLARLPEFDLPTLKLLSMFNALSTKKARAVRELMEVMLD